MSGAARREFSRREARALLLAKSDECHFTDKRMLAFLRSGPVRAAQSCLIGAIITLANESGYCDGYGQHGQYNKSIEIESFKQANKQGTQNSNT